MNLAVDNKAAPKLRFEEFQNDWSIYSLNEILYQKIREVSKPSENFLAIGVRSHCKGTFQKPNFDPTKISMDKLYSVSTEDLILNITFAWEGAIAIVKSQDEGGLVSHRFPTYTFEKGVSTSDYFKYVIMNHD